MKQRKTAPTMFLISPNRKTGICAITHSYEHSVTYNFPSASEMSFKIQKKIYDIESETWVQNPCYSKIQKNLLICTNDNNNIFHFKGDTLHPRYDDVSFVDRNERYASYNGLSSSKWQIQSETELFDIGSDSGYTWHTGSYIDSTTGAFIDVSDKMSAHFKQIACKDFIPVSNGDIVAYVIRTSEGNNGKQIPSKDGRLDFDYEILYYSDADASTFLKSTGQVSGNPIGRHCIDFPIGYEKGYIRISACSHQSVYDTDSNNRVTYYPASDYVEIYSGERHCSRILPNTTDNDVYLPIRWWVITDVQETSDKINSTKTISLYSYEYTLSNKTFSLQGGTLPLYIPSSITNLINSSNWVYDKADGIGYKHKQHMESGIINQILEQIPNWSIGYISARLLTPMKYRTFDSVDNANIYSFLINDIQSKFNCFVIFDVEKRTINLVNKDDVCDVPYYSEFGNNKTILTWNNAIKEFNISTDDTKVITAMRVHTGEDEYGIGLINPTGNSTIYNFSSMKQYMNYIADNSKSRLLSTAVENTLNQIEEKTSTYRSYAKQLIQLNLDIIQLKTKLSERLTDYKTIADRINIAIQSDYAYTSGGMPDGYIISDSPRTVNSMISGKYKPVNGYENYSTQELYNKIVDASQAYYGVKNELKSKQVEYNNIYNNMKSIANSVSITGKGDLSKTESKELDNFIIEGDWQNPNAVFKDNYTATDIYNTLVDVYNDAKEDFDNIYSQPTYEFDITSANILSIPYMEENVENMYLGNNLLVSSPSGFINPVLLSVHINYDDLTDFSMSFSTDYKRKPMQLRFCDLFGTINQISVETPNFTFDE